MLGHADKLLSLDKQLCFRLYSASRAIQRIYRPALDKLGITYPQYLVLLALWQWAEETPDFAPSQKDICTRLTLDSGTVAPLIERMHKLNLVEKHSCRSDRRTTRVSLSSKGHALKTEAQAVPEALMCIPQLEAMQQSLPQLRSLLDDLLAGLDAIEP